LTFSRLLFHHEEKTYLIITLARTQEKNVAKYKLKFELQKCRVLWEMLFNGEGISYISVHCGERPSKCEVERKVSESQENMHLHFYIHIRFSYTIPPNGAPFH
jgi:hypothetical protein